MSKVRLCTSEDFGPMLELAHLMHQESPVYRDLPLERDKLLDLAHTSLSFPDLATLLVVASNGQITGMLGAVAATEYFGPAITTCDLFLYVHPEQRGSSAALRLIKTYQKWAEDIGAIRINLGITTGLFLNETGRLYEAAGFKHSGHLYTRINPNGHLKTQSQHS